MARYRYFATGRGAISIGVKPTGWVVLHPRLSLITDTGVTRIDGQPAADGSDIVEFPLTAAQVDVLLTEPNVKRLPVLALYLLATLHPGAPDLNWGWAIRATRDGQALPAFGPGGTSLKLDAAGFAPPALRKLDDGATYGTGFEFITLA